MLREAAAAAALPAAAAATEETQAAASSLAAETLGLVLTGAAFTVVVKGLLADHTVTTEDVQG